MAATFFVAIDTNSDGTPRAHCVGMAGANVAAINASTRAIGLSIFILPRAWRGSGSW